MRLTVGLIDFIFVHQVVHWPGLIPVVLGGGAIGSAAGVLTHHAKYISGDRPPRISLPEQKTGS